MTRARFRREKADMATDLVRPEMWAKQPFSPYVGSDLDLLWVGRPDENLYMKSAWQGFRMVCLLGVILAAACIAAEVYPADLFTQYCCAFFLLAIPATIGLWFTETRKAYEYAPWYGVAKEAIFTTVWDAGHEARVTKLSEIAAVEIRAAKSHGSGEMEVGTVVCRRSVNFWTVPIYEIKFELIEQPKQVELLIRQALAEGQKIETRA